MGGLDFKQGISVGLVGLKHGAHDFGGGIVVHTAVTNSPIQAGFGVFALQETPSGGGAKSWNFYDATLSLSFSHESTLPFIGLPVRWMIESGPAYDINGGTLLEQSAGYADYVWTINGKTALVIGGGVVHCSKWSGDVLPMAHLNLSRTF